MGKVYHDLGDFSNALQCFQYALYMKSVILGDNVNDAMADLCSSIASILNSLGKSSEAKEYYSHAAEIHRKIPLTESTCGCFVNILFQLSRINDVLGEESETIKHLEEARKIANVSGYKHADVVFVLLELVMKYLAIGAVAKYNECYKEAKEIAITLPDNDSLSDVMQSVIKKICKCEENESKESEDLNERKPNIIPTELLHMAMTGDRTEGSEVLLRYLRDAKERMDRILGTNHVHSSTQKIYEITGKVYYKLGDFSNALHYFQRAFDMKSILFGDTVDGGMAKLCSTVAFVSLNLGKSGQAKEYYTKTVEIYRKIPITDSEIADYVFSLYELSLIYEDLGRQDETVKYLEEAREIVKVSEYKPANVLVVLMKLGKKYRAMGAVAKEEECLLEIKAIAKNIPDDDSIPEKLQTWIKIWKSEDKKDN